MVAQFVSGWRKRGPKSSARSCRIAPRQAAVLVSKSADRLTDEQQSILNRLSATCPLLLGMRALALEFRAALASNNGYEMRWWIQNTKQCGIGPLVRFAFGLQKDLSAVVAAVETRWSNGQVEDKLIVSR
jgi:transposase